MIPEPKLGELYAESPEHGFHAVRHTYASTLLADGVDIRTLVYEAFGGHKTAATSAGSRA